MPRLVSPDSWDNNSTWGILSKEEIHDLCDLMDDLFYTEEEKTKIIILLQEKYKDDKFILNLLSNEKVFFELLDKVLFKLDYFWWVNNKRQCFKILEWLQKTDYEKLREQLFWDYKYEIETMDGEIQDTQKKLDNKKKYKQELLFILGGVELTEEEKNLSPHEELRNMIKERMNKIKEN